MLYMHMQKNQKLIKNEFLSAYDDYAAGILRHVYLRVNNREISEDITQETFFKAWNSMVRSGIKIRNYKTFLFKIANNLIIDYYRKKAKQAISLECVNQSDSLTMATQSNEAEKAVNKSLVEEFLRELNDDCRRIVTLRYMNDFSVKEISEMTGRSKNSISVIIHRSIKYIKNEIKKRYV